MNKYHTPAMLKETLEGLLVKNEGVFVDVTYGGGGHTAAILDRLSENSKVLAFDQDPDAERNLIDDERLLFVNQNYKYLKQFLKLYKLIPVDGILADLGVSFHQFDQAERGFSFRFEGPLDMRMDKKRSLTAARVLNEYDLADLTHVLRNYGELKNASKVAHAIVSYREERPLKTIAHLKAAVGNFSPQHKQHKFFAQVFQAIRIEVNEELEVLKEFLLQMPNLLNKEGRLSVISYHSLEDRLVKRFIRTGLFVGEPEKDVFGNIEVPMQKVGKLMVPKAAEIKVNNRSRSAKLRIATLKTKK